MEKNESKLDGQISNANNAAILVIVVSVLLLCIVIANLFFTCPKEKHSKEIKISYHINKNSGSLKDSTSLDYYKIIESNNLKLIREINNSLNTEYKRMQAIVDSKEEQNIYNSYGAGIIALIIGVAGFFGFKSINEMKKEVIEASKRVASDTAKKISIAEAQQQAINRYPLLKKDIIQDIKIDFNSRFEEKELKISDEFQNKIRSEAEGRYNDLNEKYEELSDLINRAVTREKGDIKAAIIPEKKRENPNNNQALFSDKDLY